MEQPQEVPSLFEEVCLIFVVMNPPIYTAHLQSGCVRFFSTECITLLELRIETTMPRNQEIEIRNADASGKHRLSPLSKFSAPLQSPLPKTLNPKPQTQAPNPAPETLCPKKQARSTDARFCHWEMQPVQPRASGGKPEAIFQEIRIDNSRYYRLM